MYSYITKISTLNYHKFLSTSLLKRCTTARYASGTCPQNDPNMGLVVGLYEKELITDDPKLTTGAERYDMKVSGRLMDMVRTENLNGTLGDCKIFTNLPDQIRTVAVVGLGRENAGYNEQECIDAGRENVRVAAALGCTSLHRQNCSHIFVDGMDYAEQAAEGSALSLWKYQDNLQSHRVRPLPKIELYESPEIDCWARGLCKADAQNRVRRLCEMPSNQLTPAVFAQESVNCLCPCGITVEVRDMEWIEAQNMAAFLSIAKSSCQAPLFLEIKYCGAAADSKPIVLIGQGLTFNTGGVCLRREGDLTELKATMAGGAAVVAIIKACGALTLPINVTGLVPLCENMPSGLCVKPGDVVKGQNGKNILVEDTSQAATLMMADSIVYAQNVHKPKLVIDLSTCSRDVIHALGGSASGVFTGSEFLWCQMHKAGALSGDRVWRLPLWDYFTQKGTDYKKYDISNKGYGSSNVCKAAAILREFIPCMDFIHIDISGVGMKSKNRLCPYLRQGRMTGRPTRTLIQFLHQLACPDEQFKELK